MKTLAALLHTLYCNKQHAETIENLDELRKQPEICLWYVENIIDTKWECRDHVYWIGVAQQFTIDQDLDEQKAIQMLNSLLVQLRRLNELQTTYPNIKKVFIELLLEDD